MTRLSRPPPDLTISPKPIRKRTVLIVALIILAIFLFKIRDATRLTSKGIDIDSMDMMEFTLLLGTNLSSWITDTIFQKPMKAK